jgi:hypothetical protein
LPRAASEKFNFGLLTRLELGISGESGSSGLGSKRNFDDAQLSNESVYIKKKGGAELYHCRFTKLALNMMNKLGEDLRDLLLLRGQ